MGFTCRVIIIIIVIIYWEGPDTVAAQGLPAPGYRPHVPGMRVTVTLSPPSKTDSDEIALLCIVCARDLSPPQVAHKPASNNETRAELTTPPSSSACRIQRGEIINPGQTPGNSSPLTLVGDFARVCNFITSRLGCLYGSTQRRPFCF